jgi:hypothetical protein
MMKKSIRDLYDKILDYHGERLYEEVLRNWISENDYKSYIDNLSKGFRLGEIPNISQDDLWELYALTRVLDILTLRFQTNNKADGSDWTGPDLLIETYVDFTELIGLETEIPQLFDTFTCEIIEAQNGNNDFQIIDCLFPSVKLKNIILKRAGVKILLPENKYDLTLINNSTIYWAFRRKNRKYIDLSQGWGSNSQWRTDLRLDIETDSGFIYNHRGKFDLNNPTPELLNELSLQNLEIQDAIELTKYRHFIQSEKDDKDLFPFEFRYEEKKYQTQAI